MVKNMKISLYTLVAEVLSAQLEQNIRDFGILVEHLLIHKNHLQVSL